MGSVAATQREAEASQQALVIGGDATSRALVRETFEDAGWHVYEAGGVDEALILVQAVRFDLVLTNDRIGAATGLDLLHRIRCRDLLLPLVLISADLPPVEAEVALRHEAFLLDEATLAHDLPALLSAIE